MTACATAPPTSTKTNKFGFFIETKNEASKTYFNADKNWQIVANRVSEQEKPKTYFYDFEIQSSEQHFLVSDVKYKYGDFGKWRLIDSNKYIGETEKNTLALNHTIRNVPITIKKIGEAHNQTFQIVLKTQTDEEISLGLIFGINKCISKKDKEALCF